MKRFVRFTLLTLVLLAMAAVPAFADDGGQVITGRNVVVTPDSPTYGYLVVLGGNADIQAGGVVNGVVAVLGGNVTCAGTVHGAIFAVGGNVTLEPTAVVDGDVSAPGGQVNRMSGAQIGGEVRSDWQNLFSGFNPTGQPWTWNWDRTGVWDIVSGFLGKLLAVVLAVLAAVLLPNHVQRTRHAVVTAPWASLGIGFLALIVAVIFGGLLLITICLSLLGGLVWLAAWAVGILGLAALGHDLGERLLKAFGAKSITPALAVMLGGFVLMMLTYLPCCIGGLVWLVIASLGIGAAILSRLGTQDYTPGTTLVA